MPSVDANQPAGTICRSRGRQVTSLDPCMLVSLIEWFCSRHGRKLAGSREDMPRTFLYFNISDRGSAGESEKARARGLVNEGRRIPAVDLVTRTGHARSATGTWKTWQVGGTAMSKRDHTAVLEQTRGVVREVERRYWSVTIIVDLLFPSRVPSARSTFTSIPLNWARLACCSTPAVRITVCGRRQKEPKLQ